MYKICLAILILSACSTQSSHQADNTCEISAEVAGDHLEVSAVFYCASLSAKPTVYVWTYEDGQIGWSRADVGCFEDITVTLPLPSKHGALHVDAGAMVGDRQIWCTTDL